MARRISTGKLGRPILGNISVEDSTFGSMIANADVVLEPNGTGIARSTKDFRVDSANALRLGDSDNTNYVAFKSPAAVASNVTWTLPGADGTANYLLATDGSGTLSWASPSLALASDTASGNINVVLTADAGSSFSNAKRSSRIQFAPNSGNLTITGELGGATGNFSGTVTAGGFATTGGASFGSDLTITGTLTAGTVASTGNITAAGDITSNSDVRLKSNIIGIKDALAKVLKLNGKQYTMNGKDNQIGLLAQEVEEVLPQMVHTANDDMGTKAINYQNMVALLVEAVKELQQEIKGLKGTA